MTASDLAAEGTTVRCLRLSVNGTCFLLPVGTPLVLRWVRRVLVAQAAYHASEYAALRDGAVAEAALRVCARLPGALKQMHGVPPLWM